MVTSSFHMGPAIHLLLHNVSAIVSIITALGVTLFLFLNGHKKTANITFACVFLFTAIFYVSHVIGVNVTDPNLSRFILMFNLAILFIGAFNLHAVFAVLKKEKENHLLIACVYVAALVITIFFIIFPDLFLLPSVPKMYFTNYYVPGAFNFVRILFLYCLLIPFCLIELFIAYRKSTVQSEKNQLKYFMVTMIVGYGVGLVPNFLVYDIAIDPLWGILFVVVCAVPLVYGALKYELFDIRVIAKEAFLYSLAVLGVGGVITLLNYANAWIVQVNPGFPAWTIALASAVLAVTASVIVWRGLREGDLMKAEFITTVTHKFRTPLTYVKWASDNLTSPTLKPEDIKTQVEYIRAANEKLVELTNILTTASDAENKGYQYDFKTADFSKTVAEVAASLENQLHMKSLTLVKNLTPDLLAHYDDVRMKFVIQVLLENAIHYSSDKGTITLTTELRHKDVVLSVSDTGVGMNPTQLNLLFSKFFRSDAARRLDTEGMGIGLYITKRIMEKHDGKIWAESAGEGKGSTFYISLPHVK